ncbi:MAG: ABC transporter permease [Actinomycetota bacterium]|nr:ABC transporter permease [Actinomycetota bacterium]
MRDIRRGRSDGMGWVVGALRRTEVGLLLVLIVLCVVFSLFTNRFATGGTLNQLLINTAIILIPCVGEALVLFTRNIDVSVGSMIGISAVFAASTAANNPGLPLVVVVFLACCVGFVLGSINGLLVALLRVPAIMVTLGTLYVYRGFDSLMTGSNQLSSTFLPSGYADVPLWSFYGIPGIFLYAAAITLAAYVFVAHTYSGRSMLALGSNRLAADKLGIPSALLVYGVFAATGALCGLAGVLWGGLYGTVDSSAATGYEIVVLAGVVIGGVSVLGGRGSIGGVFLGAAILATISVGLALLNVSQFWVQALQGLVILGAIAAELVLRGRAASWFGWLRRAQGAG